MPRKFALFILVLSLLAFPSGTASAGDAVVGSGTALSCTEAAFTAALNTVQTSGGGYIDFNCGGAATITFTSPKTITSDVTIRGANQITLSGNNATRLFNVSASPTSYLGLQEITLTKGYSASGDGGAIANEGVLNLYGATLIDNMVDSTHSGGAVVSYGPVFATNSLFESNQGGNGGALYLRFLNAYAEITNSTFRDNSTLSSDGWGGAILLWDGATVGLHAARLEGNLANVGGAIHNQFGNSSITIDQNSLLQGNSAADSGGAIYSLGPTILNNSTVTLNTAYSGGGITTGGALGSLEGAGVTFSQNSAVSQGGAVHNSAYLFLSRSSFIQNSADFGGAIHNTSDLYIDSSTFAQNSADFGGALQNSNYAYIGNSTLSGNSALYSGGAVYTIGTIDLVYSTVFANSANLGVNFAIIAQHINFYNVLTGRSSGTSAANCHITGGSTVSLGFNLADDSSCLLAGSGDQVAADVKLSPLANYGGPTLTHLPRPGSPAIDNGSGSGAPVIDQRGMTRPAGLAVDVGAVEVQANDWKLVFLPLVRR